MSLAETLTSHDDWAQRPRQTGQPFESRIRPYGQIRWFVHWAHGLFVTATKFSTNGHLSCYLESSLLSRIGRAGAVQQYWGTCNWPSGICTNYDNENAMTLAEQRLIFFQEMTEVFFAMERVTKTYSELVVAGQTGRGRLRLMVSWADYCPLCSTALVLENWLHI